MIAAARFSRCNKPLSSVLLMVVAVLVTPVFAQNIPPWMIGDEQQMQCYFDNRTVIANPPGLRFAWVVPPPADLTSDIARDIAYELTIDSSFWTSAYASRLLTSDYGKWQNMCTAAVSPNCTDRTPSQCCVWHSNVHSCRANTGVCEPWVVPQNCSTTSGVCEAGQVLVTHTSSQVGGVGLYNHDLLLPEGSWIIIAHVKVMNFQCAVGATRTVRAPSPTSNTELVVGLVVSFVLLLILAVVIFVYVHSKTAEAVRDTKFAPREAPLAVIFTDIQDSTKLWGELTVSMAAALEQHHDVVRKCIRRNRGYEVKTAGDSHFIAIKDPVAAVRLACEIEEELQRCAWPVCINNMYDGLPVEDEPDDVQFMNVPFNGLRVRIGVHFGEPSVIYDEVACGYDYYGNDVNVSARVESAAQGGQILVSPAVVAECTRRGAEVAGLCAFHSVGFVPLKGLKDPLELFQCTPTALQARVFAPTATVAAAAAAATAVDDSDRDTENSELRSRQSDGGRSQHSRITAKGNAYFDPRTVFNGRHPLVQAGELTVEELRAHAALRCVSYEILLKPFKATTRERLLKELCEGWRVEYRRGHFDRNVANVVARVMTVDKPQRKGGNEGGVALFASGAEPSEGSMSIQIHPHPLSPTSPGMLGGSSAFDRSPRSTSLPGVPH